MKTLMVWTAFVVAILAAVSVTPGNGSPAYVMTDLTATAGLGESNAYAVNDFGIVTGRHKVDGYWKAFSWSLPSGWHNLGELPQCVYSWGGSINNSGTIAGTSSSNTFQHGVVWKSGQPVGDLGALPGGGYSNISGINDTGWICGDATASDGKHHAVAWNADSIIYDIGCLPGDETSMARAIADNGLVVGDSVSSTDFISDMFTWLPTRGITYVGRPAGSKGATPFKVNNLGQAVCQVWSTSGHLSFAMWSSDTGFVDSSAYGLSELYDINDAGMMVGKRMLDGQMVIRYSDGSTSVLQSAGSQTLVCGMNNLGSVVGYYSTGTEQRAVLWQPVPEPSSILAMLCGIGGITGLRLRRRN